MQVVYAKQPFPDEWTSAIFLAGPTPRDAETPSWRPEALRLLGAADYDGVVMVPEVEDGEWKSGPDAYMEQVEWERRGLDLADVILFWVPRDMSTMPGLTTNVELGLYTTSDKVVLGAPEWAKSIRYLEHALQTATGPVGGKRYATLGATVQAAVDRTNTLRGAGKVWDRDALVPGQDGEYTRAVRYGGERAVPLHIWTLKSFQDWYRNMVQAGNRLDDAKLLWHFRMPKARSVFSWVLWVNVWVEKEQRHKSNEYIFARTDISTVVLWHRPYQGGHHPEFSELLDTEVVLVREFRSPARTPDAMVHELPGGSSLKPGKDPLQVASEEVHEETGLIVAASRFVALGSRQLAATLSTHHSHLFVAELTKEEMAQAKALAAAETVAGVEEDSERTYVEVTTVRRMLDARLVDWSTLGMVAQTILRGE